MSDLVTSIDPTRASLAQLSELRSSAQPVVMLNLLRFRPQAQYARELAMPAASGRQAYAEYSRLIRPLLARAGAEVLWLARAQVAVIAPPGEHWDEVLLVRYPSAEAFLQMIESAEYRAIVHHRSAALEDSRLLATHAQGAGDAGF